MDTSHRIGTNEDAVMATLLKCFDQDRAEVLKVALGVESYKEGDPLPWIEIGPWKLEIGDIEGDDLWTN